MDHINPSTSFEDLRAFLFLRRVTIAGIARKHGFNPQLMQQMARQYWGTDRKPRGIVTDKMLAALREEVALLFGTEGLDDGSALEASNS